MFTGIRGAKCWQRLQNAGVITYRTDEEGAVSFYLDGKTVAPDVPLLH